MIAFVTLFLGLVTGSHQVTVAVAERVAEVELLVDGETVGRLSGEPWTLEHDFGDELTSHRLVAVARGAGGEEIGRAEQLVNVPRSAVETELVLAGWEGGRPRRARVIWRSGEGLEPESLEVYLDGERLQVEDPEHIRLPDVSPESLHFVSVELTFPGNQRASAQSAFGGRYGFELETELTAVPVRASAPVESPHDARGWLRLAGGEPLSVAAIEEGPAEVLVVRDSAALPVLEKLARRLLMLRPGTALRLGLAPEDRIFLLSGRPEIASQADLSYEVFPVSRPFGLQEATLPHALAHFELTGAPTSPQKLTDAVAVAGVQAVAGGKRRAVLLVVSECASITGRWDGETVRRFLAELRVPLTVWTMTRRPKEATGLCRDADILDTAGSYVAAIGRLRESVGQQQVLWVEGRHLPREIRIADSAPLQEVAPREVAAASTRTGGSRP